MPSISWSFEVKVTGGAGISVAGTETVNSYDWNEWTVPKKGSVTVPIHAGGSVKLLVVRATRYDALSYDLIQEFTKDSTGATIPAVKVKRPIPVDGPQLILGAGAAKGLLVDPVPQQLVISNSADADIPVLVIVGRS